jgi:L-cysteine/cystine lyase
MIEPFLPDAERLAVLREALPATAAGIYLDTLTAGPLPAETARAMAEADEWDLRTGRAGLDRAADLEQRMEEARGVLAALLGGQPDDILLTHGIADSIAVASRLAARSPGRAGHLEVVEHVDPLTGAHASLDAATRAASDRGALVCLDAGATAGVVPLDVESLGVACVAIAGQRWLLGPEGTGALWIDRRQLPAAPTGPLAPGVDPLARRSVLGLARSVGWLEMYVGLPWIHERTARLVTATRTLLAATGGVDVVTPADGSSAIVSFRIAGWSAAEAADELGKRVFAILGPPAAEDLLRISIGAYTSEAELTRFIETVALLGRHTPGTLPQRPALIVLSSGDRG